MESTCSGTFQESQKCETDSCSTNTTTIKTTTTITTTTTTTQPKTDCNSVQQPADILGDDSPENKRHNEIDLVK